MSHRAHQRYWSPTGCGSWALRRPLVARLCREPRLTRLASSHSFNPAPRLLNAAQASGGGSAQSRSLTT